MGKPRGVHLVVEFIDIIEERQVLVFSLRSIEGFEVHLRSLHLRYIEVKGCRVHQGLQVRNLRYLEISRGLRKLGSSASLRSIEGLRYMLDVPQPA